MANVRILYTRDFQEELDILAPAENDILDTRNYIYARDPTLSLQAYLGYLNIIKRIAIREAVNGRDAMLRLGFIPLVMAPSFWGDYAHKLILPHIPRSLPYYPRPAISFRSYKYQNDYPDIWVSKLDVAKEWGCRPEEVTVKGVLEKCNI